MQILDRYVSFSKENDRRCVSGINVQQQLCVYIRLPFRYNFSLKLVALPLLSCYGAIYLFKNAAGKTTGVSMHHAVSGRLHMDKTPLAVNKKARLVTNSELKYTKVILGNPNDIDRREKQFLKTEWEKKLIPQGITDIIVYPSTTIFSVDSELHYGSSRMGDIRVMDEYGSFYPNFDAVVDAEKILRSQSNSYIKKKEQEYAQVNRQIRLNNVMSSATWTTGNNCEICNKKIMGSFFKSGKHHCRICGKLICGNCFVGNRSVNNPLKSNGRRKVIPEKAKICLSCNLDFSLST
ncbi:MAG: hypothetical protein GY710_26865 [Desulfobacteraceae bacterium]|nr:hypothetical protein [Desulfobacteraceae bacterium]